MHKFMHAFLFLFFYICLQFDYIFWKKIYVLKILLNKVLNAP